MNQLKVGYETSEPGYESSGYEMSMGMKRPDTLEGDPMALSCESRRFVSSLMST